MRKKCSIPTAPFVPYWIVAQREETDMSILKSRLEKDLIDLEELTDDQTELPILTEETETQNA